MKEVTTSIVGSQQTQAASITVNQEIFGGIKILISPENSALVAIYFWCNSSEVLNSWLDEQYIYAVAQHNSCALCNSMYNHRHHT